MINFLLEQQQLPEVDDFIPYSYISIGERQFFDGDATGFAHLCIALFLASRDERHVSLDNTLIDIIGDNNEEFSADDMSAHTYLAMQDMGETECITHTIEIGTNEWFFLYLPPLYTRFTHAFIKEHVEQSHFTMPEELEKFYTVFSDGVMDVALRIVSNIIWRCAAQYSESSGEPILLRDLPDDKWSYAMWAERAGFTTEYDMCEAIYGNIPDLPDKHDTFLTLVDSVSFIVKPNMGVGISVVFNNFDDYFTSCCIAHAQIVDSISEYGFNTILSLVRQENQKHIMNRLHGWKREWYTLPEFNRNVLPEFKYVD